LDVIFLHCEVSSVTCAESLRRRGTYNVGVWLVRTGACAWTVDAPSSEKGVVVVPRFYRLGRKIESKVTAVGESLRQLVSKIWLI
jgi:hypothetical protein